MLAHASRRSLLSDPAYRVRGTARVSHIRVLYDTHTHTHVHDTHTHTHNDMHAGDADRKPNGEERTDEEEEEEEEMEWTEKATAERAKRKDDTHGCCVLSVLFHSLRRIADSSGRAQNRLAKTDGGDGPLDF